MELNTAAGLYFHERARTIVNGLAGDRHVIGVHHAMDEPDKQPAGDKRGLTIGAAINQFEIRPLTTLTSG